MTKRERIVDLVRQIDKAEEYLARLRADLDKLLPPDEGEAPKAPTKRSPRGLTAALIRHLDEHRERSYGIEELAKVLGIENTHSLRSLLVRLGREGKVRKVGRGAYTASDEPEGAP